MVEQGRLLWPSIKAWCTASQSYQRKDLLLTILKQINPVESDVNKMDDQESLKRRRIIVSLMMYGMSLFGII
ncbi:hypothetical protein Leryth_026129 [Lithospermum erythrorhizon]|nr:hypothetical protein Leryth_026129 [Lithospermum erythrorhizon]